MTTVDARSRTRRRAEIRVGLLRKRLAVGSTAAFLAFFVLVAQHASGTPKRRVSTVPPRRVATAPAPVSYFDERDSGYAFADPAPAPSPASAPAPAAVSDQPAPPPVAQTSAS